MPIYRDSNKETASDGNIAGGGSSLQSLSRHPDNQYKYNFASPYLRNKHIAPQKPYPKGWLPHTDQKPWYPGTYRSAFYSPDTRLIKFTIKDRVATKKPSSSSGIQQPASNDNPKPQQHPSIPNDSDSRSFIEETIDDVTNVPQSSAVDTMTTTAAPSTTIPTSTGPSVNPTTTVTTDYEAISVVSSTTHNAS